MKRCFAKEEGAAAVEFALLLPLLTLLIVGTMMFGLVFNAYLEVTHAAREGVRWASLRSPLDEVEQKTMAAAGGLNTSLMTVVRTGVEDPVGDDDQDSPVTVTVTYQLNEISALFGTFGNILPEILTGTATQRVE